jgi:hypothetical protein
LPTESAAIGDLGQSASRALAAKTGKWILSVEDHASSNDLNGLIMQLFGSLTPDLGTWQNLSQRFAADLSLGLFLGTSTGFCFGPVSGTKRTCAHALADC